MSDDHTYDLDGDRDDPLARIRARFEQASERILSGTDDEELLLQTPAGPTPEQFAPVAAVESPPAPAPPPLVGNARIDDGFDDDGFDDFGEIDIKDDARFSLDFEPGVGRRERQSGPVLDAPGHGVHSADLPANLAVVREDARDHVKPTVDSDRHTRHRTRGRIETPRPGDVEPASEPATGTVAPAADPKPERSAPKTSNKKSKSDRTAKPAVSESAPSPKPEKLASPAKRSHRGLALIAVVLLLAGGAAAYFLLASAPDDAEPPPSTTATTTSVVSTPPTPADAATAALEAFGFSSVQVTVDEDGTALITGKVKTVRERDLAVEVVAGVEGVVDVATDITYDVDRDAAAVRDDVEAVALTVNHPVTMQADEGIVTVTGIVPKLAVDSGELGSGGTLEARLLGIDGVEEVRFDLTMRGNPTRLQNQIVTLLTDSPIVYDPETGQPPPDLATTLDQLAGFMAAEPGLTIQIGVRGDADPETLLLAEQRRDAVVEHLMGAGVEPAFLQTVLVDTLAPSLLELESDVLIAVVTG